MQLLYRSFSGFLLSWIAIFSGAGLLWAAESASPPPIALYEHSQHVAVDGRLEYLIEPHRLSPFQVSGWALQDQWIESSAKGLNFGSMHPPVWFRFNVINRSDRERTWWLEIGSPLLDRVEMSVYNHASGTWHFHRPTGQRFPIETRPVQHRHFVHPLTLAPDAISTIYVRVDTKTQLMISMDLWQQSAFLLNEQFQLLLLGLFYGVLGGMFCYNLSLYFFTRDRSYLFYSFYVFFIILYTLAETGLGNQYLWHQVTWLQGKAYPLFASASFLAATMFIREFLALKKNTPWINRSFSFFLAYWTYATISYLVYPHDILLQTTLPVAAIGNLVALATGIYLWIRGNASAKYFTIAWSFLLMGTLVHVLMLNRTIARTPFTQYIQMIGFVIEVVLLSLALAERINRARKEQASAQVQVLQLTEKISMAREEKLMVQEQLLEVQRQTNEALEVRVLERTNELERALNNLETANKELSKMSFADPMTKLYNRRYFDQILASEIKRASRTQHPLSLLIADIDHFKQVNDRHGHLIGDECLRIVAKTLSQQLGRSSDLIARFGGEEFGIILPATAAQNAMVVADRARDAVEQINFIHRGKRIPLRVSLGVAGWIPSAHETPEQLLSAADKALQDAKQSGRNRVAGINAE